MRAELIALFSSALPIHQFGIVRQAHHKLRVDEWGSIEARSAFAVGEKSLSSTLRKSDPYCGSTSGLFVY